MRSPSTIFHRLAALLRELWASRLHVGAFDFKAQDLRRLAMSLEDPSPSDGSATSAEQATYVRLMQTARESPQLAIVQGWESITELLDALAIQQGRPTGRHPLQLLNSLEQTRQLSFLEYALLRDLLALRSEAMTIPASTLSTTAALDYAVAIRRGQRLLSRLAADMARVSVRKAH